MEGAIVIRKGRTGKWFGLLAVLMVAVFLVFMGVHAVYGVDGLDLNTDYPGVSVKPGDNLDIPITLENHTGASLDADLKVPAMPEGWEGYLQSGSYQVSRIHAKNGGDGSQVTLHVTVPKELTEGTYTAEVEASAGEGLTTSLPISFMVNEMSVGEGSFTSECPQQERTTSTNFSFSTTLINDGLKTQSYSLSSNAPSGWGVGFTPTGETAKMTALEVGSGVSKGMTVSVTLSEGVAAGEYDISYSVVSAEETSDTSPKVVITGSYGLKVSTLDGCLGFDAYAGRASDAMLSITNTGNVDLENVTLNSSLPTGQTVTYNTENNVITSVPAESTTEITAHVKPSSEAITGDYVNTSTATCEQTQSNADLRVSVKTKTVWGVVTVIIILGTAGGLGYMFHKHGRRQSLWSVRWEGGIVMDNEEERMIWTEHLSKSYGEKEAVCDLTLEIRRGEIFGLLGSNGAGKTTTTLILLGLMEPTGGSAYIDGKSCTRQAIDIKRMVGYLLDSVGFYSDMMGRENLRSTSRLNGLPDDVTDRRIEELLEKVGMTEAADQKAGTYSWGMRQRLGIADVLMKDLRAVTMDESTLGIDPEGMRKLMTPVRGLVEDDKRAILILSHQLCQIQQICDRVGLFVEGRLIACGRIDELVGQMRRGGHYVLETAAFPDDSGLEELLRSFGNVEQVERSGDLYVVHSRADLCRKLNRKALEKGYILRHLRQRGNDLDEIYRRCLEKGEQENGGLNQKKNEGLLSFGREQRQEYVRWRCAGETM